jgi:hypothetical protein
VQQFAGNQAAAIEGEKNAGLVQENGDVYAIAYLPISIPRFPCL